MHILYVIRRFVRNQWNVVVCFVFLKHFNAEVLNKPVEVDETEIDGMIVLHVIFIDNTFPLYLTLMSDAVTESS